jgi:hypothetical protein
MNIHYFQVKANDILDALDIRNNLIDSLSNREFEWIDATGGQAAFNADNRSDLFKAIVDGASNFFGVPIVVKTNIEDPGLGLF